MGRTDQRTRQRLFASRNFSGSIMNTNLNAQASRLKNKNNGYNPSQTRWLSKKEYCDYNDDYECQEQYDYACMSKHVSNLSDAKKSTGVGIKT